MKQITLRSIPDEIEAMVKKEAKGLSLNKAFIALLEKATGVKAKDRKKKALYHDLDNLSGVWSKNDAAILLSPEEEEKKKAIFEAMSARSRKRILDKGYENWDPFLMPKDPLDMRIAHQRKAAAALVKEFMQICHHKGDSNAYAQGVWEICMGIIGDDARHKGMYEFSCWYREKVKSGGLGRKVCSPGDISGD